MHDFFGRQEIARKNTVRFLFFFALAVLLLIVSVYLAVRGVFLWNNLERLDGAPFAIWNGGMFAAVAAVTLVVIVAGSLYKVSELRGGGGRVAEMLGGRQVLPGAEIHEERRLLNVVEEMSIASGVPVPDVYVLDRERGINAFAAGFTVDDAVICVTKGAMHLLDRDELQGVVAHEFSHVLNSDTSINIRMMGWLHGILLISLAGEGILRGLGRTRSRSGGAFIFLGFSLYLLGYLGVFFGSLIKAAISRQREHLADASAVQFTRNPSGLAGALKKIGGLMEASFISHPKAMEASHMYFSSGMREAWLSALETHPPLLERIRNLEPHFDGPFPSVAPLALSDPAPRPAPGIKNASPGNEKQGQVVSGAAAAAILDTIGAPMKAHEALARELITSLPEQVRNATRNSEGACALVYALLIDRDEEIRTRQLDILRSGEAPGSATEAADLAEMLRDLSPQVRLPLVDLAMPSLRLLPHRQFRSFKERVEQLSAADRKNSIFEFLLRHAILRHLEHRFIETRGKVVQIYSIRGVTRECSCVLSLLARTGHRQEEEVAEAFAHGRKILLEPKAAFELLPPEECTLPQLEQALKVLAVTSPVIKRKVLAGFLECMFFDKTFQVEEVELFRAVADALGCPVPPWLSVVPD